MISKDSIDRIFNTVRIEEVVGDFVPLKKRGVNLIGLCPFHNEKTPSFNVNPVRNIYKCFGCGKGGNAVNFIMDHEQYSYPEALRFLAKKYNIEIEETVPDPKDDLLRDEKESLFVINTFAQKSFSEILFDTEEGRSVGLSYFKERGFTEETIRKFQLGYTLSEWSAFTDLALKAGYKEEFLEKTGLTIKNDAGKKYDRFRGRVMFPIHNLSGRVIGFGGRVLKKDEKTAKYVNSPESEIYHKSQSLYGIYFAKKAIVQRENCFLVEGYTDVISLHQSGIENVVASSGTSLTVEQIRLIGRYTKNVTVLYDGDAAGIKASIRGIDLILEEGLNVKVVLFPDGDDPDSYSRKHSHSELLDFVNGNAKDFVMFKTGLLLDEVKNDPVRKAGLVRDVVETIAKIPDPIIRSMYLKQSSAMMDIQENLLIAELNKIRRQQLKKDLPVRDIEELLPELLIPHKQQAEDLSTEIQEKNIIRLLFNFGNHELHFHEEVDNPDRPGHKDVNDIVIRVARYIVDEIANDELAFENTLYDRILKSYTELISSQTEIDPQIFLNSEDPGISELTVELLSPRYFLSENWEVMHKIIVPVEEGVLKDAVEKSVFHLKNKKVLKMIDDNQKKIKAAHEAGGDYTDLMEMEKKLQSVKMEISKVLGIDILK
ncbi:MAG: DNA primase [Bacteroidetes bacterium]|nr:DNA primase [Bacteroidota bacterium]MBK9541442.1 DNA primase [Bacteroidota bacterium]MBP6402295.1 DNA primase [Bacteroidia bacterium]